MKLIDPKPTGRRRHRTQRIKTGWRRWESVLVLQVEERGIYTYWMAGTIDTEWLTVWRDARVSDLTVQDATLEVRLP